MSLVLVKLLTGGEFGARGDTVSIPSADAMRLVKAGEAVPVRAEPERAVRPPPETRGGDT